MVTPLIARRKKSTDLVPRPALTVVSTASRTTTTPPAGSSRRTLTASARPLDLSDRSEGKRLAETRQRWQGDAWAYRRSLGELRYAVAYLGNAAQRMRIFAATIVDDEVVPLEEAPGIDQTIVDACRMALAVLGTGPTGLAPLLKLIMENFEVAGECFLVGSDDPLTGVRAWTIRSTSETVTDAAGRIGFRDLPGSTQGSTGDNTGVQWADPANTFVARLWCKDPEFSAYADSPVKAVLDVLEELLLIGRDVRATARSRLANNGILAIPQELTVVPNHASVGLDDEAPTFGEELMATAQASLTDEGSSAAVVPLIAEGPAELLDHIRHIKIDRDPHKENIAQRTELISRLATGIDLPPEILTGKGDANHWSAWAISEDTFRDHIEPLVITIVDALTVGYLWPTIEAVEGVDPLKTPGVFFWYDPTELVTKPDRSQDAKDAWDRGALSDEALRGHLGFPETDAPEPREVVERMARQVKAIDATLQSVIIHEIDPSLPLPPTKTGPAIPAGPPDGELPVVPPVPPKPPADGPPNGGVPPAPAPPKPVPPAAASMDTINARLQSRRMQLLTEVLLAASPPVGAVVAEKPVPRITNDTRSAKVQAANRQLVDIDRRLRERLLVAANAAVKASLSRAGAKIVSKSRTASGAVLRDAIEGLPSWQIPFAVGPSLRAAAGLDERNIIDGSLTDLKAQWDSWVAAAQQQALRAANRIAGLPLDTAHPAAETKFAHDRDRGWTVLDKSLRERTTALMKTGPIADALDDDDAEAEVDESSSFVSAGLIRGALALAGGFGAAMTSSGLGKDGYPVDPAEPMGQIGTGDTIAGVLEESGAQMQGYQWVHGPSANPFEPHEELDGTVFASFTGDDLSVPDGVQWGGDFYAPGDHAGCLCDFMPVWTTADEALDIETGEAGGTPTGTDVAAADGTETAVADGGDQLVQDASPEAVASSLMAAATDAEPALTSSMTSLADTHGGSLAGLDFRLKTEDSLARKIAGDVTEKGLTPAEAGDSMFDINRYTMTLPDEQYAKGAQAAIDDLRSQGYETKVKNFWANESNPYQGVNMQVKSPAGQKFELQFHTQESLRIKETENHAVYEKIRVSTNPAEIARLQKEAFDISAKIPVPRGVGRIK